MGKRGKRKKVYFRQVPEPNGNGWINRQDIRIWLPAGQPYKKNLSMLKNSIAVDEPGWKIARLALDCLLRLKVGNPQNYDIGWVEKPREGLSREVYEVEVTIGSETHSLAISLPLDRDGTDIEIGSRMIKECEIFDIIGKKSRSFVVPQPFGMIWENGSLVSVRGFVHGYQIADDKNKSIFNRHWEIIAQVAANIHRLPTTKLPSNITRYSSRQEQAISMLNLYKSFDAVEIQDALQWITENLPAQDEPVLVHGDLLGQNIYSSYSPFINRDDNAVTSKIHVLDWEYAVIGDPAYDLAIVSRGSKRPFGLLKGLDRFLEAYLEAGGKEISKKDVQVYELLLCLGWYQQSLDRSYLDRLRGMLKRVVKG